jgi:hypothetical protein
MFTIEIFLIEQTDPELWAAIQAENASASNTTLS